MKKSARAMLEGRRAIFCILVLVAASISCCGKSVREGEDGDGDTDESDLTLDEDFISDVNLDDSDDPVQADEGIETPDAQDMLDADDSVDAETPSDLAFDDQEDPPLDAPDFDAEAEEDYLVDADAHDVEDEELPWVDADRDGHPVGEDCDDANPWIIPGSIRACSSACDHGTQTCLSGDWTPCTAQTDCSCTTPGETEIIDCGRCGQASRTCTTALTWSAPTACYGESECFAGELDEQPCEFCGMQSRLCGSSCTWLPWATCEHPGECFPGVEQLDATGCPMGLIRTMVCMDDCLWSADACTDACPGSPRTGGYEEEVCIPGGPFLMGCSDTATYDCEDNEKPQHRVYLTPYYIEKYEVTNARYRACVDAGVCVAPLSSATYHTPGTDNWAVSYISVEDARTFCDWDAGRVLPTEAQWEKAAKGPDPADPRFPWGDDIPSSCDDFLYYGCPACHFYPEMVDESPLDVSYYSVVGLMGGVSEYISDFYQSDYYSISPEFDPQGPASGIATVNRGYSGCPYLNLLWITRRGFRNSPTYRYCTGCGFRCARPAIRY